MAGRGRGRGGSNSFSRELTERLGGGAAGSTENTEPVFEPPPLYPPLETRPIPLDLGLEGMLELLGTS